LHHNSLFDPRPKNGAAQLYLFQGNKETISSRLIIHRVSETVSSYPNVTGHVAELGLFNVGRYFFEYKEKSLAILYTIFLKKNRK
jgi:hypothetical protein